MGQFEDPAVMCGMAVFEETACTKQDVYDSSKQVDAGSCCDHCSADKQCRQWSYHSDTQECYLSSTTQDRVAQSSTTCGISSLEPAYGLQHIELYDQNADKYQMRNIYGEASDETKLWLHETLSSYFKCSDKSCP